MEVSGQLHASAALARYPLNTAVGWLQKQFRRFGEEENHMPLPGFEARTFQSVAQWQSWLCYPGCLYIKRNCRKHEIS